MTDDTLKTILEAEQEAERIKQSAKDRKEQQLEKARLQKQQDLSNLEIELGQRRDTQLAELDRELESIKHSQQTQQQQSVSQTKEIARQNHDRAVKELLGSILNTSL